MKRALAVLALAIAACATGASSAPAKTVTFFNVVSPSKMISCYAVLQSSAIECTAPYLPDRGDLDPYLRLKPRGHSHSGQRGDFPGHSTPRHTLHYGDTWKRPGIRCRMRRTGLTCRNRDHHGFHVQRGNVRRF